MRFERTRAVGPGGLAGRCTAVYATPPKNLAEGAGVEPTGVVQAPTVFGTAWRARAQPSFLNGRGARIRTGNGGFGVRPLAFSLRPSGACIRRDSNPQAPPGPQLYRLLPNRFGL